MVLVEPFPKPLESCKWDGGNVSTIWSKILHPSSYIFMVGLVVTMSMSRLHSLMERVRLGSLMHGWMNLLFVDWEKFMQYLYMVKVSFTYIVSM